MLYFGGHVEIFCYSSALQCCMYQGGSFGDCVKDDTDSAASSLKAVLTQPYVLRQPGSSSS